MTRCAPWWGGPDHLACTLGEPPQGEHGLAPYIAPPSSTFLDHSGPASSPGVRSFYPQQGHPFLDTLCVKLLVMSDSGIYGCQWSGNKPPWTRALFHAGAHVAVHGDTVSPPPRRLGRTVAIRKDGSLFVPDHCWHVQPKDSTYTQICDACPPSVCTQATDTHGSG